MFSINFKKIREYLAKFIKPSLYLSGLNEVIKLWQNSNTKDRGILLLTFSPMFICLGGFVFSVIYFVLFVLPSFVFGLIGWGLLSTLFGYGGKYLFKHFTGREIESSGNDNKNAEIIVDVQYSEESEEQEEPEAQTPKKKTARKKTDEQ